MSSLSFRHRGFSEYEKFQISTHLVGLTIEQTFFRGVISHRVGCFLLAQGRCLAAREFRELSKKCDFWRFRVVEIVFFARNIENL